MDMPKQNRTHLAVAPDNAPEWTWRNCRSLGVGVEFWLWPWSLSLHRDDDVYGGEMGFSFGPFGVRLHYSIGNVSSEGLERFTALSCEEAYQRALTKKEAGDES